MIEPIQAVSAYKGQSIEYYTVKNFCRQQYEKDDIYSNINFYNLNDAKQYLDSIVKNDNFISLELEPIDKMLNTLYKYEMLDEGEKTNNYSIIWQLSKEEITIYKGE